MPCAITWKYVALCFDDLRFHNLLYPAYLTGFQPDFDAMRMGGRIRQDVSYHAFSQGAGPLVLLLNYFYQQTRLDKFSVLPVHVFVFDLISFINQKTL